MLDFMKDEKAIRIRMSALSGAGNALFRQLGK